MADISLEEFETEARAFLDANATSARRSRRVRVGRGLRQRRAVRREGPRARAGGAGRGQGVAGHASSTPASAGSPARPSTAAGSCPAPTSGCRRSLEAAVRRAQPGVLRHRPRAWSRRRSSPTPPTPRRSATCARMYRGDIVGCQLFTEPGAGSDLAGLQTRAERDGDEWIITGQKVWTSGAQYSDIGEIICRTDPDLPKHKGLTGFVVDMQAPGVEVRPLRQMTGGASFNEVFFNEVRVPDDHRLGDVNQGWTVALTTLMNERASIGAGGGGGSGGRHDARLIEMVRHFGLDTTTRSCARSWPTSSSAPRWPATRTSGRWTRSRRASCPGPRCRSPSSRSPRTCGAWREFVAGVLGPRIIADTGEWGTYAWSSSCSACPACASPAAPTRSCATSSASGCSACPRTPASTRRPRSTTSRSARRRA